MMIAHRIGALSAAVMCALPFSTTGIMPTSDAALNGAAQDGPGSVEDLAHGLMAALRQDSFEALIPYLPTAEDLHEVLAKMVADGALSEEQARQNEAGIPGILEALDERLRESFASVREVGTALEVNWEEAEITGYHIDLRNPSTGESHAVDLATLATLEADQMLGAAIVVNLASSGQQEALSLGDCVRTSRGWLIMEDFYWTEPRR